MKKLLLSLIFAVGSLASVPAARAQGYTDALLTSINFNTTFPCGNGASTATENIQQAIAAAAHFGGGTVDLTCYQGAISIDADIFSTVSAPILLYLPEHAVMVTVAATIPSNFEICGGPGASISGGSLTNHAAACFAGFTGGGGGGSPGGADGTIQYNHAGAFGGILGSSVDPVTGDVALGAQFSVVVPTGQILFEVDEPDFGIIQFNSITGTFSLSNGTGGHTTFDEAGLLGINFDTSIGTGPINLTSAGGVSITDNSINGITIAELGVGGRVFIQGPSSNIGLDDGVLGIVLVAPTSQLDLDETVSGVATLSTIFNAVGGYQANGVAGISEVCTVTPTGMTISFGIITAITGGTCVP